MTPDFEWVSQKNDEGVWSHFLVDPAGQVRADVDEPRPGRISYIADLYWSSDRCSNFISLSLAKSFVELAYADLMKPKPAAAEPVAVAIEVQKKKSWLSSILRTLKRSA